MKKLLYPAILTLLLFSSTSCAIYGLTDDYKKTTPEQKELISNFQQGNQPESGKIYHINATQLKTELARYPQSMIYVFTNGCSGEACLPMSDYIHYARRNGYQLFLVMNGFGSVEHTLSQNPGVPLFAVDSRSYDSKYRFKYMRRFENDLLSRPLDYKEKEYRGNIYFFKGDQFEKIVKLLPEENIKE